MRTDFSVFIKQYFPDFKVQKISVNAVHSCPTRDGTKGLHGCTYCNNRSFSPEYTIKPLSVSEQLRKGVSFYAHKYPEMRYLAYFQSYTNTYGSLEKLTSLYEEALEQTGVVGLVIGTRPDCMSDDLLDYLEALSKKTFVMIEYGVESTLDRTLLRVQRGHTYAESENAIRRTAERGIPVGAHLILGLPGEDREAMLQHADRLSELPVSTLKMHQLQIIRGTTMEKEYAEDPRQFSFFDEESYADFCIDFLKRLRKDIIVDRFVSQSPPNMVVAPRWGLKNYEFVQLLNNRLLQLGELE